MKKPSFGTLLNDQIKRQGLKGYLQSFVGFCIALTCVYLLYIGGVTYYRSIQVFNLARKELLVSGGLSSNFKARFKKICDLSACEDILFVRNQSNSILASVPENQEGLTAFDLDSRKINLYPLGIKSLGINRITFEIPNVDFKIYLIIGTFTVLKWPLFALLLVGASAFGFFSATRRVSERVSKILGEEISTLTRATQDQDPLGMDRSFMTKEGDLLHEFIEEQKKQISNFVSQEVANKKNRELSEVAVQLAHDIQIPIETLKCVAEGKDALPSEDAELLELGIDQISDISEDLLTRYKGIPESEELSRIHLYSVFEKICREKSVILRTKNISFHFEFDQKSLGAFIRGDASSLYRAISNLIRNSVQAVDKTEKIVRLILKTDGPQAMLIVEDNGKGMPTEMISKIGVKGATFGKDGGLGLGLSQARQAVEKMDGNFSITSRVGVGTTITLLFPLETEPIWFTHEIPNSSSIRYVVAENSLAAILKTKFSSGSVISLKDYSERTFKALIHDENNFFIFGDEFSKEGSEVRRVISEYDLARRSLLILGNFQRQKIAANIESLGVKVFPKALLPQVRSSLENQVIGKCDLILIDNELMIRKTWSSKARRTGLKFFGFETLDDFLRAEISKSIPIFIDVNLGQGASGIKAAEILNEKGFKAIHLSTGIKLESWPSFIRSVRGKEFPTDLFPPKVGGDLREPVRDLTKVF